MDDLDEADLAHARAYTGGFERRKVTRTVFSEYGEESWALEDFLADIEEAVAEIPGDKRAVATVELEGGYDESTRLKISYPDVESDDELRERIERAVAYARNRKAEERAEFERLKAKYGR
jgi:hypothetical protein